MKLYIAMESDPNFYAPSPTFKSVHRSLIGAVRALNPEATVSDFTESALLSEWVGFDGFARIREVDLKD